MQRVEDNPDLDSTGNASTSARFLVINSSNPVLSDPTFRLVLFCAIARVPLRVAGSIESFVTPGNGNWYMPNVNDVCGMLYADRDQVVEVLKGAGYTWQKEPTRGIGGEGLILPDGTLFPTITLLSLSEGVDPQRAHAAQYIEGTARELGISLTVQSEDEADIRYAVFSSGDYDMAILGWRLSHYPGYLCEWFGAQGQFDYNESRLWSECEALAVESDLEIAQQHVFEIQSILVQDLPFIPLYADFTYDAYRNIRYPFDSVLGGLSGLYGAPSLAIPAP
jgi:ABC-type transport system substrate-binding protein